MASPLTSYFSRVDGGNKNLCTALAGGGAAGGMGAAATAGAVCATTSGWEATATTATSWVGVARSAVGAAGSTAGGSLTTGFAKLFVSICGGVAGAGAGATAGRNTGALRRGGGGVGLGPSTEFCMGSGGAIVRVEKTQLVSESALAWDARASGAARKMAQCASSTKAVNSSSRQDDRRLEKAGEM